MLLLTEPLVTSKEFSIWFFFLSTESKMERLVPADNTNGKDNSLNTQSGHYVGKSVLTCIPSFLPALQVDVEGKRRIPEKRREELARVD
jgi:hypothetical protein